MARTREVAHRMFAVEFNASRHEDRGLEENAPNYVITPLGAHVNRLYFVGNLMSKVNSGTEDSPIYKAEIRGPTGTFYLFAGQYQPQPLTALGKLEPPELVGVVGKVRTFQRDDGAFYVSVKPESVFPVDIPQRDRWAVQTAERTMDRIRAIRDALSMEEPSEEALVEMGHSSMMAKCGVDGVGLYGLIDLEPYKEAVRTALNKVIEGGGRPVSAPAAKGPEEVEEDEEKEEKGDLKKQVMEIIEKEMGPKGALYRDIMAECEGMGIDKIQLEEIIQELLDEGAIYEPTIGLIKPI